MNRRQKIILSVTSIFLVLLILVGLTYAYFLTQIRGNTNERSISVTTADLKLEYGDGNGLITAVNVIPGVYVTGNDGKTFTVENKGNATVTNYGIFLTDVVNTLADTSDLVYTLTCVSKNATTGVVQGTCNGVSSETEFPTNNSIVVTNNIDVGIRHEYRLDVLFKETNDDQSDNMNKQVSAKVDLYALAGTIDIEGTVTGYQNGDYIVVNSAEAKKSIVMPTGTEGVGYYKVVGLLPDNHTITLYDSEGNSKGSETFVISKGSAESVSGDTITMTDSTRSASIALTYANSTLTKEVSNTLNTFNPYKSGTLAYAIVNNAIAGTNGTVYRATPLTIPGHVPSLAGSTSSTTLNEYSNETYFGQKWVAFTNEDYKKAENAIRRYRNYATNSDDDAGQSATDINEFLTSSCDGMVGKLLAMVPTSYSKPFEYPTYLVTGCSNGKPVVTDVEKELSVSADDYGNSYYFRGNVTDNFLNLGGMCWRIVRIEGDGSIKLILEDKNTTCDNGSYTGNWSIGSGKYGSTTSVPELNLTSSASKFADFENGNMRSAMTTWLNGTSIDQTKLKTDTWCFGDRSINYYEEFIGDNNPFTYEYGELLETNNTIYTVANNGYISTLFPRMYDLSSDFGIGRSNFKCLGTNSSAQSIIGTLDIDEITFAGAKVWKGNEYYLFNNYQKTGSKTFLTLSYYGAQYGRERIGCVRENGKITGVQVTETKDYRPSIVLKAGTTLASGNGLKTSPYTIN